MEPLKFWVKLNTNPREVWRAWTETEKIINWFSPEANIEPRSGGAYELYFDPKDHDHMSTKGCTITEFKPMDRLGFSWKGPDQYRELMNEPDPLTHVEVEFKDEDGATQLTLEHGGWGDGEEWVEAREWHRRAWKGVLDQLESFLSPQKDSELTRVKIEKGKHQSRQGGLQNRYSRYEQL